MVSASFVSTRASLSFPLHRHHDECHRWLERNKGLRYEMDNGYQDVLITKEISEPSIPVREIDPADAYEDQLLQKIDDKMLRKIFCGLCY